MVNTWVQLKGDFWDFLTTELPLHPIMCYLSIKVTEKLVNYPQNSIPLVFL